MKNPTLSREKRRQRRGIRIGVWAVSALAGFSLAASAVAASATPVPGAWWTDTNMRGRSLISLDAGARGAGTETQSLVGSVPAGYLGIQSNIVKQSTGAICASNGWAYTNITATGIYGHYVAPVCGAAAYYSYGYSRFWAGTYYQTLYNYYSPALNFS